MGFDPAWLDNSSPWEEKEVEKKKAVYTEDVR